MSASMLEAEAEGQTVSSSTTLKGPIQDLINIHWKLLRAERARLNKLS